MCKICMLVNIINIPPSKRSDASHFEINRGYSHSISANRAMLQMYVIRRARLNILLVSVKVQGSG